MATFAVVTFIHLLALGLLLLAAIDGATTSAGIAAAFTAYLAGLKHAFDPDHIGAMDNATRKFVNEGRRPTSVGLAFSAGHSLVVLMMCTAIILGFGAAGDLLNENGAATTWMGVWGASVAGSFLILIGLFNLVALIGLFRARRELRAGQDEGYERSMNRTAMARLLAAPMRKIKHPRHIFLLGFAFSWGFDTATTIGLLVLTGAGAASGLGTIALFALPLAFMAAMTLGDTVNGLIMLRIYSGAEDQRARKVEFSILITTLSVLVAFFIGFTLLITMLRERLQLADPVTGFISDIKLDSLGYVILGAFLLIWAFAALRWRRPPG